MAGARELRPEYDEMLFFAIGESAAPRLIRLLAAGANPNAVDADGTSALHRAIGGKDKTSVAALLEAGADPLLPVQGRGTPWEAAHAVGREFADLLRVRVDELTAQRVRSLPGLVEDPDRKDARGFSELHLAAMDGLEKTVAQLISAGAQASDRTLVEGDTALHLAARGAHARVCRILVDAASDLNAENDDGQTPLHIAARSGCKEITDILVDAGASPDARNRRGLTPTDILRASRETRRG